MPNCFYCCRTLTWCLPITSSAILALLCALGLPATAVAQDFWPEHPKVRSMVEKGTNYLSNLETISYPYDGGTELLIAYTIYKASGRLEHPKVQAGLQLAVQMAQRLRNYNSQSESKIVYSASVAAVFLADVDPVKYRTELDQILAWLLSIQRPHGGFGYLDRRTGDTSQVQYAMLAMWAMHNAGVDVPVDAVENTFRYLRSTIDPSGGWGYEGKVSNGAPVPQERLTKSLSTAGAGAVLIAGDLMGFFRSLRRVDDADGIPEAFERVDLPTGRRSERKQLTLTRNEFDAIVQDAERYHENNGFTGGFFYYYWRYSQERYESFREIMKGKQNKSPAWYNQGVADLAAIQEADGRWAQGRKSDFTSDDICTCFSILFLIRSTQKTIGKLDEGVAFGGYGLPDDVSTIKMVGDRIVGDAETSVENLLTMLEEDEASDIQIGLLPNDLQLTADPAQRREQVARLSRLLVSGDYNARRVAAKLLGRSEDLNQVPDLIYALTDEDPYVPQIAEESLRLLSRKLNSGKLGASPDFSARQAAVEFWKKWYLGLRPDYIFIDR